MKILKKLLFVVLLAAGLFCLAMYLLPGAYQAEESVAVTSGPLKVFVVARSLAAWNTLASMARMKGMPELPDGVTDQIQLPGGIPAGKLLKGVLDMQKKMASTVRVTDSKFPERINYELEGGAYDGLKAEILIEKTDAGSLIKFSETLEYKGFLAPVKAIVTKYTRREILKSDLEQLKNAVQ